MHFTFLGFPPGAQPPGTTLGHLEIALIEELLTSADSRMAQPVGASVIQALGGMVGGLPLARRNAG